MLYFNFMLSLQLNIHMQIIAIMLSLPQLSLSLSLVLLLISIVRVEGVEVEEAVADSSRRDNIHEINNSDKIKHDIFSNNTRLFSVLLAISAASNQF